MQISTRPESGELGKSHLMIAASEPRQVREAHWAQYPEKKNEFLVFTPEIVGCIVSIKSGKPSIPNDM